jgi:long-subunit fatty acid transport protein
MKFFFGFFSAAIVSILLIVNAEAQNTNDVVRVAVPGLGSSARALGMGNSYIALSDDASASFFNPAGFGLLKRLEFSGGFSYVNFNNNTSFFNTETEYSNSSTRFSRVSFAFPFPTLRGSLVFGLAYHKNKDLTSAMKFDGINPTTSYVSYNTQFNDDNIFNLGLSYPVNGNDTTLIRGGLNQFGDIINSGDINNWTFSGAVEIYKNLFVGLNLNIISGSYENTFNYNEEDLNNLYQGLADPADNRTLDFLLLHIDKHIDWDISGWDAKMGILYQINPMLRIGTTVQFPKVFSIKENYSDNFSSDFANTGFALDPYSDEVEYDIVTPYEFGFGFALNVKGLIFSAEGTLTDYSQSEFDDLAGFEDPAKTKSDLNRDIKDQLAAAINYNLGLEYTIPQVGLRLRGGFLVQPSPYEGDPPKYDRKYLTAGIGFLAEETVGIDLAYAHGWWEDFGDNYGSGISRTFQKITVDNFILSAIYRF